MFQTGHDFPESAGNRARAIMDSNMNLIAEKLQIPVPHRVGTRNDLRTCIEFLDRAIPIAKKSSKINENGSYKIYQNNVEKLRKYIR